MISNELNQLYREMILDHANHPHHKGALAHYTDQAHLQNTTCGDDLTVQVDISPQKVIEKVAYTGSGCTISQASASMMTDAIQGQTLAVAAQAAKSFSDMALGKPVAAADLATLQDAKILSNIMQFPTRIKCATLAWWALQNILARYNF